MTGKTFKIKDVPQYLTDSMLAFMKRVLQCPGWGLNLPPTGGGFNLPPMGEGLNFPSTGGGLYLSPTGERLYLPVV